MPVIRPISDLRNKTSEIEETDELGQSILRLEDIPLMGLTPKNRRLVLKGYKIWIVNDYLIFYVIDGGMVEIRRILSGKRNYTKLL